jgi:hypothetical protein
LPGFKIPSTSRFVMHKRILSQGILHFDIKETEKTARDGHTSRLPVLDRDAYIGQEISEA